MTRFITNSCSFGYAKNALLYSARYVLVILGSITKWGGFWTGKWRGLQCSTSRDAREICPLLLGSLCSCSLNKKGDSIWIPFFRSYVSRLTSYVSRLTSYVSRLTSHVSRLTSHLSPLKTYFHSARNRLVSLVPPLLRLEENTKYFPSGENIGKASKPLSWVTRSRPVPSTLIR